MTEQLYDIKLTEDEVKIIGAHRWYKPRPRWILIILLMAVIYALGTIKLGSIFAFGLLIPGFLMIYLGWREGKLSKKAGQEFLEEVKNSRK